MRGATRDVPLPPVSLGHGVPPSFVGSDVTVDLVTAFDQVLAPVVALLDDLDAYLDLRYAPDDCVLWMGSWLSSLVDVGWPADRVRARAGDLAAALVGRGTMSGLTAGVRACTGHDPVVRDTGGVAWSVRPGPQLPGRPGFSLEVEAIVDAADGDAVHTLVHAVVEDLRPAHVPARVTFTTVG